MILNSNDKIVGLHFAARRRGASSIASLMSSSCWTSRWRDGQSGHVERAIEQYQEELAQYPNVTGIGVVPVADDSDRPRRPRGRCMSPRRSRVTS